MLKFFHILGTRIISFVEEAGKIVLLLFETIKWALRPPYAVRDILRQMEQVGVNSMPVVLITATFTGMVLALQSYTGFKRFNAESLVGTVVALSMTRELGPVLTGLMVSGRVGAAMAAELGTMRVTEQIDALLTLATNPVKYLIVPRFIAALIVLPILTAIADMIGIMGGYFIGVNLLGANPTVYMKRTREYLELEDIYGGLLKAAVFGIIIALIGCYQGFYTRGGAEGVGIATTRAVVLSSMMILISNYFITAFLF